MTSKLSPFIKFVALLAIFFSGCGYLESKEKLAEWVKQSMQEEVKKDEAYRGLSIGEVVLVRESSSKLSGFVEFKYGSDSEKAKLTVTVDGDQKIYQCEPPRSLIAKKTLLSAKSDAEAIIKTTEREECIERGMTGWEEQREQEVRTSCADLAKKGEECRISAGQDALVRQEALAIMTTKCQ